MAQREDAAVQMEIKKFLPVDVPKAITLALPHDEVDAEFVKPLDAAWDEVFVRRAQDSSFSLRALRRRLIARGIT